MKQKTGFTLPAPFAWIDIPGKDYSIAKYPITNAQFATFIEAGGYMISASGGRMPVGEPNSKAWFWTT